MAVTKKQWAHKLRSTVTFEQTGSTGIVIGRAHFIDSNPKYLIRYAAQGAIYNVWIDESALLPTSTDGDTDDKE